MKDHCNLFILSERNKQKAQTGDGKVRFVAIKAGGSPVVLFITSLVTLISHLI